LTTGACFNSGNLCISDGQVQERVLEELNKRKEKELALETKKKNAESHLDKVEAIHAKGLLPSQWDQKDLGTMVSWFKRPGDKALPSTKEQLLRQHYRTCNNCEWEPSRLKEGETSVLDNDASTGNPSNGTPNLSSSGSGNPRNSTPGVSGSGSSSGNPSNSTLGVSGSRSSNPSNSTLSVSSSGNPSNGTPNLSGSRSSSGNPSNSTSDLVVVEAAKAIGLLLMYYKRSKKNRT